MHVLREEIVGNNKYKMKKKQKQLCGYVVSLYNNCNSHKLSRFVYSIDQIT
jgi:hypothetical protein